MARNHPMVRVSQAASAAAAVRLDVGNQSAFMTGEEALDLHTRLEGILVLRGLLAPAQRNFPEPGHVSG